MKNVPSILAAAALLFVLLLYMCTFQVRSTEVAIIKTFGKAQQDIDTPLDEVNEGQGVRRGTIEISDRAGNKAQIDLTEARLVTDVLEAINQQTVIRVRASVFNDRMRLEDLNDKTDAGSLMVRDLLDGHAGEDLGIAGRASAGPGQMLLLEGHALSLEDDVIKEPGLEFKWPWPVQSVVLYDKRLRILSDRSHETRTADSKNIILTTFAVWTVADPYKFHVTYPDEEAGRKALRTKIRSHTMAVAGKHAFSEFVSTDPDERKLAQIEREMMELVSGEAAAEFGVDVKMFGIKQLALPEEVTKAVFASMKKTEEIKAENYKAEGHARAAEIVARATAARQRILAVTKRKVDAVRNDAQREEAKIYQAFAQHQDLRIFLDKLRTLEEVFKERTTLFLDPETPPVDLFDADKRGASVSADAAAALTATVEQLQEQQPAE